jgi:hypothetical protein
MNLSEAGAIIRLPVTYMIGVNIKSFHTTGGNGCLKAEHIWI